VSSIAKASSKSRPNCAFRDYHLLLHEQADQIFEMTDDIAERAAQNWRNYTAVDRRHLAAPALTWRSVATAAL
jgi:hypothetical protein